MKKLFIILLIFVSIPLWASSEKKVTGFVRTELGELMSYVDIHNADNTVFAITDSTGKFTLTAKQDTITLFFSHLGYI